MEVNNICPHHMQEDVYISLLIIVVGMAVIIKLSPNFPDLELPFYTS